MQPLMQGLFDFGFFVIGAVIAWELLSGLGEGY